MIRIKGLHKSYSQVEVLKGLNLHVEKGDIYGFIGSNGSGKTTTMNIITSLLPYDKGEIIINDNQPYTLGYLPETPSLFPYLTGKEYLDYIAACCKYKGDVNQRTSEILERIGLTVAKNKRTKQYSRGMLQRLGIGATIYNDPDILIFDEPTSALDIEGRAAILEIMKTFKNSGKTVIFSSHILDDVEKVATKIGILCNGSIVAEDTLEHLQDRYAYKDMILIECLSLDDTQKQQITEHFGKDVMIQGTDLEFYSKEEFQDNTIIKFLLDIKVVVKKLDIQKYNLERIYMEVIQHAN